MNGFLVELVHTMDDIPVGLFATRWEAMKFAMKLQPMPDKAVRDVFSTDASTPVCVTIVEFRGGKPVSCENVKAFE